MTSVGTVVGVDGEKAIVLIQRTSACEGCHKQTDGGCSVCTLIGSGKPMQIAVENRIGASVGDRVECETRTARVLGYAAGVFLLPLLLAGFGYWLFRQIWRTEVLGAVGAVVGFFGAFLGLRLWSAKMSKQPADIVLTKILPKEEMSD